MKIHITIFCLLISFFSSAVVQIDDASILFEKATKDYNEAKYQDALDKYKQILKKGKHSAEVYYNIGNTYYKLNNIPQSIFFYECALRLSPNDKEILNNLNFAKTHIIDLIEDVPEAFMYLMLTSILPFTYDTVSWLAILFLFVSSVAFIFTVYKKEFRYINIIKINMLISLFLSVLFFVIGRYYYSHSIANKDAILIKDKVDVLAEPNSNSDVILTVYGGTKVRLVDDLDDWARVKLGNGNVGWIEGNVYQRIKIENDIYKIIENDTRPLH